MPFCSHCGKAAEGRFCAACGTPVAPDAVASVAAAARRQQNQLWLIAAGLAAVIAVSTGLVIYHSTRSTPAKPAPAAVEQQIPPGTPSATTTQPEQPASASSTSSETPAISIESSSPTPSQTPSSNTQQIAEAAPKSTQPPLDLSAGSDRYPGSQSIEIDKSKVPDMGIPISSEAYSTTDSVETVLEYYRQRYPDAKISEMQGQHVIAVERNGTAKVIAIGTNGSETRIAIVQPN